MGRKGSRLEIVKVFLSGLIWFYFIGVQNVSGAGSETNNLSAEEKNLIFNGDFEKDADEDGVPDGWYDNKVDLPRLQGFLIRDTLTFCSGNASVRIEGPAGVKEESLCQDSLGMRLKDEFSNGKTYLLSVYIRTENVSGKHGAYASVCGFTQDAKYVNIVDVFFVKGTTDWKRYEKRFTIPDNTVRYKVGLILYGTGKAWFDNLKIVEVK